MLGKMASYEEEILLYQLIRQARTVRNTYKFKLSNVLDALERVIPQENASELKQLDRLLMALDELQALD